MKLNDKIDVFFSKRIKPEILFKKGFLSIILIEQGSIHTNTRTGIQEVNKGSIIINTPTHDEPPVFVSEDCEVIGVKFAFDCLKEIKILDHIQDKISYFEYQYQPVWILSTNELQLVHRLLEKVELRSTSMMNHLFGNELFTLAFTELILELADIGSRLDTESLLNYKRNELLAQQFIALARQFYKTESKLDFYAEKLFVTTKYLSETVKEITKRTAKEVLIELRLSHAKLLLSKGNLDVSEIAYQLSYDSPSSFSKYFKQMVGMSPKEYRDSII